MVRITPTAPRRTTGELLLEEALKPLGITLGGSGQRSSKYRSSW